MGNTLLAATDGYTIGVVNDQDKTLPINMVIRDENGDRIDDLGALPVWTTMNINISGDDVSQLINGTASPGELASIMYGTTLLGACVDSIRPSWSEGRIHRLRQDR